VSDKRTESLSEVRFMADLLIDLAEQIREHCPVIHPEVVRSLAVVDYAIVRLRNGKLNRATALDELAKYFTSGNEIPVERATILAKDFWRITGLTEKKK